MWYDDDALTLSAVGRLPDEIHSARQRYGGQVL
jgi:hypothetical protein